MDENMVAKVIQKLFIFILISLKMLMRIWSIRFKINGDSKFIIKSHEPLAENRIKKEIKQCKIQNIRVETILMNSKNSKMNEPYKFPLNSP